MNATDNPQRCTADQGDLGFEKEALRVAARNGGKAAVAYAALEASLDAGDDLRAALRRARASLA